MVCWLKSGKPAARNGYSASNTVSGLIENFEKIVIESLPIATVKSQIGCNNLAQGDQCLKVKSNGLPSPDGTYVAQCTSSGQLFADFIVPALSFPRYEPVKGQEASNDNFTLSQFYPRDPGTAQQKPWLEFDFETHSFEYIMALRSYIYGDVANGKSPNWETPAMRQKWFNAPLLNYGETDKKYGGYDYMTREYRHGMTRERSLTSPELGVTPEGKTIENYAVAYYNTVGAYTLGQTWTAGVQIGSQPTKAKFGEGALVFKVLYTLGQKHDFKNQPNNPAPSLAGAPKVYLGVTKGQVGLDSPYKEGTLLQMDVAVRDSRAKETGWVFGTFAYNENFNDGSGKNLQGWEKMAPVGLMWGNDPGVIATEIDPTTNAKQCAHKATEPINESWIARDHAPAYALAHLGCNGRLNGPVDHPSSSCLSCHSRAQTPQLADLVWPEECPDQKILWWFRNLDAKQAFGTGKLQQDSCVTEPAGQTQLSLDYSLQTSIVFATLKKRHIFNPCAYIDKFESLDEAIFSAARSTGEEHRSVESRGD